MCQIIPFFAAIASETLVGGECLIEITVRLRAQSNLPWKWYGWSHGVQQGYQIGFILVHTLPKRVSGVAHKSILYYGQYPDVVHEISRYLGRVVTFTYTSLNEVIVYVFLCSIITASAKWHLLHHRFIFYVLFKFNPLLCRVKLQII